MKRYTLDAGFPRGPSCAPKTSFALRIEVRFFRQVRIVEMAALSRKHPLVRQHWRGGDSPLMADSISTGSGQKVATLICDRRAVG